MAGLPSAGVPVDFTKPIDYSVIQGRTALVTGGAGRLGAVIARELKEYGCSKVFMADCDEERANEVQRDAHATGVQLDFIPTDITDWDSQFIAFANAAAFSPTKTVDIVVTAAGVGGTFSDMYTICASVPPTKPPTTIVDTNLTGTYYSAILALWYFSRSPPHPSKQLLLLGSLASYTPSFGILKSVYAASKFGVRGLFHELHPQAERSGGARVNMLCPTLVETSLLPRDILEGLRADGWKTANRMDVVDGAMRVICNAEVRGRSILIASGKDNGFDYGDANFDMQDEAVNMFGGKAFLENLGKLVGVRYELAG